MVALAGPTLVRLPRRQAAVGMMVAMGECWGQAPRGRPGPASERLLAWERGRGLSRLPTWCFCTGWPPRSRPRLFSYCLVALQAPAGFSFASEKVEAALMPEGTGPRT